MPPRSRLALPKCDPKGRHRHCTLPTGSTLFPARNLESSAGGAGAASAPPAQANTPAPDERLCAHLRAHFGRQRAAARQRRAPPAVNPVAPLAVATTHITARDRIKQARLRATARLGLWSFCIRRRRLVSLPPNRSTGAGDENGQEGNAHVGPAAARACGGDRLPRPDRRGGVRVEVRGVNRRSGGVLAGGGQAARLDPALYPGEGDELRLARRLDQMVRGRPAQCRGQLHRPPSRDPGRADRDHLGERRPRRLAPHQLPRAARGGLALRQRPEGARHRPRRPRRPLPADDPRGRLRDARLRPDRRGALGGLRRLLRRGAALAPRGLGREAPRHRRRGAARRPPHALEGECRQGDGRAFRPAPAGGQAHRGRGALGRRPRRLARRGGGGRRRRLPAGGDGRPRTRSSSSTRAAAPASPRGCCTPRAATCFMPR